MPEWGEVKKWLIWFFPYFWTVLSEPGVLQYWYSTTGSPLLIQKLWISCVNPFPVSWMFLESFWCSYLVHLFKVCFFLQTVMPKFLYNFKKCAKNILFFFIVLIQTRIYLNIYAHVYIHAHTYGFILT